MYSETIELDLSTVEPSLAGPRRPQDRVSLKQAKSGFAAVLPSMMTSSPKTAAEAAQVGSKFAAARALSASRARAPRSEISRRNAAASAGTSLGGTSSPAPTGTVSGIAPAVVPITGTP